ncbi:MAG: hypothetical protein RIF41_39510 [Polyangiaceae bacterium]
MGRNRQASFTKRKKEQERQQRKAEKAKRRATRQAEGAETSDEEPIAEPIQAMSAEETRLAIEHAMNPGTRREKPKDAD